MVCKPINQVIFKLEEMYYTIVWVYMTARQASVFDAKNFDHLQLARNVLNQLPAKFPANQLLHAMRSGTLGTEHLD
jgi:hypothetical protein